MEWFLHPVKYHYADFEGRATVQQFWMFTLWYVILSIGVSIVAKVIGLEILATVLDLALIIPSLAIGARRLHDINKSGWWQLLSFIPIIGWIVLIVWAATKGEAGTNKYGPDPRTVPHDASVHSASASAMAGTPLPPPEGEQPPVNP